MVALSSRQSAGISRCPCCPAGDNAPSHPIVTACCSFSSVPPRLFFFDREEPHMRSPSRVGFLVCSSLERFPLLMSDLPVLSALHRSSALLLFSSPQTPKRVSVSFQCDPLASNVPLQPRRSVRPLLPIISFLLKYYLPKAIQTVLYRLDLHGFSSGKNFVTPPSPLQSFFAPTNRLRISAQPSSENY